MPRKITMISGEKVEQHDATITPVNSISTSVGEAV